MQSQAQEMSKKNKVTVPFYSPPTRLYGQTPAEIIKEARAAVMNTSAVGIKPVFTSRPFTPKEKERTLFGNVKKRNSRPPSSFSLKNLQSQESGSRVKLPSIDVVSRRKTYSNFHYSNNLSLDNLTEDYDAEALEEVGEISTKKLPKWKKAHSCPKEGRLIKATSNNELNSQWVSRDSSKRDEKIQKDKQDKFFKYNLFNKDKSNGDQYESDSSKSSVFGNDEETEQFNLRSSELYRNPNMARGGGDFEKLKEINYDITTEDTLKQIDIVPSTLKHGDQILKPEENKTEIKEKQKEERQELLEKEEITSTISQNGEIEKGDIGETIMEKGEDINRNDTKNEIEKDASKTEEKRDSNKIKEEKDSNKIEKDKRLNKIEILAEKSIATAPKSEYLTAIKEGYKSCYSVGKPDPVPLEILELYETARYYDVVVDSSSHAKSSTISKSSSVEDYFGEKPNDNLNDPKEKFDDESDENVKNLNKKIPAPQKKEGVDSSSENIQFVMNNKKKYHTVSEKDNKKENAYERWNNKQEMNKSPSSESKPSSEGWDLFWKNSYFRSTDNDVGNVSKSKKSQELTELESLQYLVNTLSGLIKIGPDNQEIYNTTVQIYNLIKGSKLILDTKTKNSVLKALYLYADNENPKVLLGLARILLQVKLESSLAVAFKMIFKVARSDANDHLFLNEEDILDLFLEGIGRSSPLDSAESCIYGYGALKFLTMNYSILSKILHMGALDLMTLHLKMIKVAHVENGRVGEQTHHALFQLTGALRNVAAGEGALPIFLTTNCITIMCETLQLFQKDDDIVTNISRTLSLLSKDESVTQVLMSVENILTIIIELIERYKENDKILIRLSYCLGNIVEHSDLARVQLSRNDTSLTVLLDTLKLYIDKDLEISMRKDDNENSEGLSSETVDDIIVKVIRIIANMSMNPIVGSNLSPAKNEKKSVQLSKLLSVLLMRKDPGITLLATLGCLNNISYYCEAHSALIDITQGVERALGLPFEDCQAEAARVLGNLTRHKDIRDFIYSTGGVNQLIELLRSQDQEVVRCACGALVNMMLDSETRQNFLKAQGVDKLVKSLEVFSGDWSLASLAARAIWNSCADDLSSAMTHNNMDHLLNFLTNSLEEENWNDGDPAWEEFAAIATDLLERINSYLETT